MVGCHGDLFIFWGFLFFLLPFARSSFSFFPLQASKLDEGAPAQPAMFAAQPGCRISNAAHAHDAQSAGSTPTAAMHPTIARCDPPSRPASQPASRPASDVPARAISSETPHATHLFGGEGGGGTTPACMHGSLQRRKSLVAPFHSRASRLFPLPAQRTSPCRQRRRRTGGLAGWLANRRAGEREQSVACGGMQRAPPRARYFARVDSLRSSPGTSLRAQRCRWLAPDAELESSTCTSCVRPPCPPRVQPHPVRTGCVHA